MMTEQTLAIRSIASLLALFTALVSPAAAETACGKGARSRLVAELLLGRNIGRHVGVSEAQFQRFLDAEVTPRFPSGFSVLDMHGQYRSDRLGSIIREPGKYLMIVLDDAPRDQARVRAIAAAYKRRFRQESVGIIMRQACVSF